MDRFDRYTPPGIRLAPLKTVFYAGLVIAFLYSLSFMLELSILTTQLEQGVDTWGEQNMMLPAYSELIGYRLIGFEITALCVLPLVFYHYSYFRRDSQSWYLMRRVESPWELHLRCWALPVLASVSCLIAAWILYWLYCGWYFMISPEELVPAQEIPLIWRLLP